MRQFRTLWKIVRDAVMYRDALGSVGRYYKVAQRLQKPSNGKRKVVLCELNELCSSHVIYAHLCNLLSANGDATIMAYVPKFPGSSRERLQNSIARIFRFFPYNVYHSFGARDLLIPHRDKRSKERVEAIFEQLKSLEDLRELENFSVRGVFLGDLLYDDYLVTFRKATIDLRSEHFLRYAYEFIELFVYWEGVFDKFDVVGVNVSHCVYMTAIPLRLALKHDIPSFQASLTHVYRLKQDNMFAYRDFVDFKEQFSKLPKLEVEKGIEEAKKRIERRFRGEVGVDMSYSTKSAFAGIGHDRLVAESDRTKVLIAAHCFFDAVHCFGENLFPDFYKWFEYLGQMSEKTNYDWYVKTHPDFMPGNQDVLDTLLSRYPKIKQLPSTASHHQIISEGVDVVLTVYGTIGFEYAALGVPVVNASTNNPHIGYAFNIHPRNIDEYGKCILNLDGISLDIDIDEVYSYYYMKNVYNTNNIFAKDYEAILHDLGGYAGQFLPKFYLVWKDSRFGSSDEEISAKLANFVASDDFRMNYNHAEHRAV